MNGQSAKALRKAARDASEKTAQGLAPDIQAALQNEFKTRTRVAQIEAQAERLSEWAARHDQRLTILERHEHLLLAWNHRPFWGRLAWLLTGK